MYNLFRLKNYSVKALFTIPFSIEKNHSIKNTYIRKQKKYSIKKRFILRAHAIITHAWVAFKRQSSTNWLSQTRQL